MSSKLLVIIATGENEKALTGLMYASRTLAEGWMDEVKVIFFGPSERLLVEDEQIAQTAKKIGAVEKPIACKFISDRDGISEDSQLPPCEDYLYCDPDYPAEGGIDAYAQA